ncbi:MAG TPA: hypothetical protein VJ820_17865 [Propionibacteriaceae bacterium]|nr:hypothetical protein [Propionibacteriaceae bacterium]
MITIFVDDFDGQLASITARGLEPEQIETYDNGVRKATFRDPDGNQIGFGGAPIGSWSIELRLSGRAYPRVPSIPPEQACADSSMSIGLTSSFLSPTEWRCCRRTVSVASVAAATVQRRRVPCRRRHDYRRSRPTCGSDRIRVAESRVNF